MRWHRSSALRRVSTRPDRRSATGGRTHATSADRRHRRMSMSRVRRSEEAVSMRLPRRDGREPGAHRMTPRQIDLIRTSWSAVEPISDAAARLFYDRLFESDPAIKRLFANTDMQAQRGILMQTLALLVSSLDDFELVVPVLEALGRVHAGYGVRQRHYDTVEAALLWALDRGLGEAFDDETADGWATAYSAVASVMIEAAADVVDESAA